MLMQRFMMLAWMVWCPVTRGSCRRIRTLHAAAELTEHRAVLTLAKLEIGSNARQGQPIVASLTMRNPPISGDAGHGW